MAPFACGVGGAPGAARLREALRRVVQGPSLQYAGRR